MSIRDFQFDKQPVGRCALCRGAGADEHLQVDELLGGAARFVRCSSCGLIYLDPAPTPESLAVFYRDIYPHPEYRALDGNAFSNPREEFFNAFLACENIMDQVTEYQLPPGRLLDVGCAHGGVLLEAATQGWKVQGVELSADGVAFCTKELHLPVEQAGFMEARLEPDAFDVILMLEFIEHAPDPVQAMRRAHKIAKQDAVLFITSPNADSATALALQHRWMGWRPPTHLHFLNRNNMVRLLNRTGWTPLRIKSAGAYPGQILAVARKSAAPANP